MRRRSLSVAVLTTGVLAVAACAPQSSSDQTAASTSAGQDACSPAALKTLEPDTLTIGTDQPAYEPWFSEDAPENGKGFESAVAYAVADQLGYSKDQVTWTRVPFNAAIQPGARPFDFDINQFSITEERKQAVDFSSPYYDVAQAVVTVGGSKAAKATSLADLKDLKIGAQVGTTSYDAILSAIDPSKKPGVYNNNDDVRQALENGQVDAVVVDLPTAFFMTAAQLDDGKIVGQLPAQGDQEQFGLVLDKGSPLTACVSAAVDALRDDGTLDALVDEWLSQAGGAPALS
jgi:polar amino acid transport system substrate-binding protein